MLMFRRIIFPAELSVFPAALLVLLLSACGPDDAPPPEVVVEPGVVVLTAEQVRNAGVTSFPAMVGEGGAWIRVPGTVLPPDTARVVAGSFVEGRVTRVLVVEGDRVRAGAPLVRIHSHELADWEREASAAEAHHAQARNVAGRGVRLHAAGAISTEELERRQVALAVAEADLRRAREILEHLNPDAGDVVIRAPREGVVFRIEVAQGEAVLPGDPLVELGTTDVLWVVGGIPETAVADIDLGAQARVTFPARPGIEASGEVVGLGARVDPRLRTTTVRVQLASIPPGIRPGMLATVELETGSLLQGVRIPVEGLQEMDGEPVVFLDEGGGRFRALPVRLLARLGEEHLVDGIPERSRVVGTGAYTLRAVLEGFLGAEGPE
jgi:membrane fusion protein, heavy metal efflux system